MKFSFFSLASPETSIYLASPETSISFVMKLDNVEMYVHFPHEYPSKKCAEIFVRSNELTRDNQSKLNKDMLNSLNEVFEADCAITSEAISWLQEHLIEYTVSFNEKSFQISLGAQRFINDNTKYFQTISADFFIYPKYLNKIVQFYKN